MLGDGPGNWQPFDSCVLETTYRYHNTFAEVPLDRNAAVLRDRLHSPVTFARIHVNACLSALSNSNTRQSCGVPGRLDSIAVPPMNSAITRVQNGSAPKFPSDTRTIHR